MKCQLEKSPQMYYVQQMFFKCQARECCAVCLQPPQDYCTPAVTAGLAGYWLGGWKTISHPPQRHNSSSLQSK